MPSRRHVLTLLAAAPFASNCAPSNLPDPIAAWRNPGAGERDPRRFALAHAILAPNPHNTQPWLVELDGDDGMTLYCDLDRRLPFTDPLDRQITMGCGAFVYLCWMALGRSGRGVEMQLFPDGAPAPGARLDERPIARWRLADAPPIDGYGENFLDQVTQRRTNRNAYDTRIPANDTLRGVASAAVDWMEPPAQGEPALFTAHFETAPERVAQLRDLVWRAWDREMHTLGALEETFGWLRFGHTAIAQHGDGLAIDGPMIPLLKAIGQLDREELIDPDSQANKQAAANWRRKAETAPAFMWLTTPDDTPLSRIYAGMAYVRMNLAATAAGIAMHPWSQALQEYEEMADLYAEARELLGAGDQTVQMLVRVGYADAADPAPRRALNAFVRA